MTIPGAGKTAYNTQESVFKLPGMIQPFIAPPSNSDAAKPYKKEVEKKFNFNPYTKTAADGFVPNFRGGMNFNDFRSAVSAFEKTVIGFERHITSFGSAIKSLNFREFATASQEINKAATTFSAQSNTFKTAAETIQKSADKFGSQSFEAPQINLDGLNSSANKFSQGVSKLSRKLSEGVTVEAKSVVDSINSLTTALGKVSGTIEVEIDPVKVNVQGNVSTAVKAAIKAELPTAIRAGLDDVNIQQVVSDQINARLGLSLIHI